MIKWLRHYNTLSLDVVAGALAGGCMATGLLNVVPPLAWWIVLGASVWLIYTIDHLSDAYRSKENLVSDRRLFYLDNFNTISIIVVILTFIIAIIAFTRLPLAVIYFGVVLGVIILLYLATLLISGKWRKPYVQKEMLVGIFYTAGIWGAAWALDPVQIPYRVLLLMISFLILAWADLLLLSFMEEEADRAEKLNSFAVNYGKKITKRVVGALLSISIMLSLVVMMISKSNVEIIASAVLILMGIGLAVIIIFEKKTVQNYIYRPVSEAIFIFPVITCIF